jgi:predicted transcriptional regulator of viral defense system
MATSARQLATPAEKKALAVFKRRSGMMRLAEALRAGVSRGTLERMLEKGTLERLSRGLYRLVDAEPLPNPDLAVVAAKVPDGVICLISALSFHELTTQIPHEVYVAVSRTSEPPRIAHPPIRSFRFSGAAFSEGVEKHRLGPITVRVYSREKTLADCFKYRNRIGLDTCLEAVRFYKRQKKYNVDALLHFAKVCRVAKVMQPYLESIL